MKSSRHLPASEDLTAEYWPLDGPYDAAHTVGAASVTAELVRYLNYATRHAEALPWASTAGGVVGALDRAAAGLDQTLDQLGRRVRQFSEDPTLYDHIQRDDRRAAQGRITTTQAALADARRAAAHLHRALADAHSNLNALGHRT